MKVKSQRPERVKAVKVLSLKKRRKRNLKKVRTLNQKVRKMRTSQSLQRFFSSRRLTVI